MADTIKLECRQCDAEVTWRTGDFVSMLYAAENTRINFEDSGSLDLSLYICDDCLGDDE
jgi:hypothetical protein